MAVMIAEPETVARAGASGCRCCAAFDLAAATKEFHLATGLAVREAPEFNPDEVRTRHALFSAELHSLYAAVSAGDDTDVAGALAGMLYVLHGDAHTFGIRIRPMAAPHRTLTFAFKDYTDEIIIGVPDRVEQAIGELVAAVRATACQYGIPLAAVTAEVHRSTMAHVIDPQGPGSRAVVVAGVLARHRRD